MENNLDHHNRQPGFSSGYRPGFLMTFENGWTVSVKWHNSAYCTRITPRKEFDPEKQFENPADSKDAEIAAWNDKGDFHVFEEDDVLGYVTPEELVDWLVKFKSM